MESDTSLTRLGRSERLVSPGHRDRKALTVLAGIGRRLTYANVVSTLCLFLLLGGGAYAAFSLPTA